MGETYGRWWHEVSADESWVKLSELLLPFHKSIDQICRGGNQVSDTNICQIQHGITIFKLVCHRLKIIQILVWISSPQGVNNWMEKRRGERVEDKSHYFQDEYSHILWTWGRKENCNRFTVREKEGFTNFLSILSEESWLLGKPKVSCSTEEQEGR